MRANKLFEKMVMIHDAIQKGESVKIKYRNPNKLEVTDREIIPMEFTDGHNVLAFCGKQKDYRKFSMENIIETENHK